MDDLTQRIVEAGARAIHDANRSPHQRSWDEIASGDVIGERLAKWFMDRRRTEARACLSAAHALAEQENAVRKECLRTALEAVAREAQACPPGTAEVTLAVVGAIARAALAGKVTL